MIWSGSACLHTTPVATVHLPAAVKVRVCLTSGLQFQAGLYQSWCSWWHTIQPLLSVPGSITHSAATGAQYCSAGSCQPGMRMLQSHPSIWSQARAQKARFGCPHARWPLNLCGGPTHTTMNGPDYAACAGCCCTHPLRFEQGWLVDCVCVV
jgi:hypothetical protein